MKTIACWTQYYSRKQKTKQLFAYVAIYKSCNIIVNLSSNEFTKAFRTSIYNSVYEGYDITTGTYIAIYECGIGSS